MQRVTESHNEHISPVILYLDDIEAICAVLEEVEPEKKIEIRAPGYRFSDVKALQELKQERIHELHLGIAYDLSTTVVLTPSLASIWGSGSTISRGATEKIKQILVRGRRRPTWLYGNFKFFLMLFASALVGIFPAINRQGNMPMRSLVPGMAALDLIFLLYVLYVEWYRHSTIFLRYRIDSPSFFKRNADQIAVGIITALLGAIAGVIGTLIVQQLLGSQ